jgi:hypothetical protein
VREFVFACMPALIPMLLGKGIADPAVSFVTGLTLGGFSVLCVCGSVSRFSPLPILLGTAVCGAVWLGCAVNACHVPAALAGFACGHGCALFISFISAKEAS